MSPVQYKGAGAAARAPDAHAPSAGHARSGPAVHRVPLPQPHCGDGQLR